MEINDTYIKTDLSTITVVRTSTTTITMVFNIDELLSQRQTIQDKKDLDNQTRIKELEDIDNLIIQYNKLSSNADINTND